MRNSLRGAAWRIAVFLGTCALGLFALLAIFGQLRFNADHVYRAEFANVSGLIKGDFVRIAGVEVGQVKKVTITPQATALVEFSADDTVTLTGGSKAIIKYDNLIGGRYLSLEEGQSVSSSGYDHRNLFTVHQDPQGGRIDRVIMHLGELIGWLFITEEHGSRRRHIFHPERASMKTNQPEVRKKKGAAGE